MKKMGQKKDCGVEVPVRAMAPPRKVASFETPELPENRADISQRYYGFSNSLIIYKENTKEINV